MNSDKDFDSNTIARENDSPTCETVCVHPEVINNFDNKLILYEKADDLAELFKTLADPTRVRIIDALAKAELCVCDLAELLNLSQSATSHQLRVLRGNKLVKYRREGKMVYYALDDEHVLSLYNQGLEHINEHTNR
ncbi:metalloregulator ArsR/SmtB family transcription factor [Desulfosporosinus sp. FKA]|uniref:ArsR/SmtB family transcription factor n=1 Tax=Desulfosporosinus sp. FKA TaxID=1969834 RepID=UPI001FA918D2|nr:metalloregulator ArsR/SmtB family transcription factor [Desulfosporosinus sp. FKA]